VHLPPPGTHYISRITKSVDFTSYSGYIVVMNKFKEIGKMFSRKIKDLFNDNIVNVVLFGSVAKNEESFDSDIDILVIVKRKDIELKDSLHSIASDYLLKYDVPIGLKVIDFDTFSSLSSIPTDFYREVQKTGISI